MKVKRQHLVDIFSYVKPGIVKKNIIDWSSNFIFTGKSIATYNDKIGMIYPFESNFKCAIPADEFFNILSNINQEEVELELDNSKLKLKSKGINLTMAVNTSQDIFKTIDDFRISEKENESCELDDSFIDAISLCLLSVSNDQTDPILTCIFIKDNLVVSSDNYRISEYVLKKNINKSLLIPADAAVKLAQLNIKKYHIDDNWAYFFDDKGLCLCIRLVFGDFYNYTKFLDGFETCEIVLPADMKNNLLISSVLSEGEDNSVKEIEVSITNGKLKCAGKSILGDANIECDIKYQTDREIKFYINPVFFAKILDVSSSMFLGENKVLFKNGKFRHVISSRIG